MLTGHKLAKEHTVVQVPARKIPIAWRRYMAGRRQRVNKIDLID
jgi:hypothetical protein